MIDIGKILKRSWNILWDYKILWIFGFLLALTSGGGGSNAWRYRFGQPEGGREPGFDLGRGGPAMENLNRWLEQNVMPLLEHPEQHISTFIWIGILSLIVILFINILFALIRYPSETAVIRLVDEYEQTGAKMGFRQGWQLGWSRRAFRLWVMDLILILPVILFVLVVLGASMLLFITIPDADSAASLAILGTSLLCIVPLVLVLVVLMVFLGVLRILFARAIALEGVGVGEAVRSGWALFKRNWKSIAVIWLTMVGMVIVYVIASIIAFFVLIPAYIVLAIPAAIVAAIPGLIALAIASLFATSPLTWMIAALAALPFFFVIAFAPMIFLNGWYMLYSTNVWTLTYRELKHFDQAETLPRQTGTPPIVTE
ncbi:MAG: DUF7544 domain-containing protein [Candidatus Villigracilaceae bacterium]